MTKLITRKIEKGLYQVKGTTWYVEHDPSLDGELHWVLFNTNDDEMEKFYDSGNDQLRFTKKESLMMLNLYLNGII